MEREASSFRDSLAALFDYVTIKITKRRDKMKKIVVGIPIALFSALILVIAWVNLASEENASAKNTSAEASAIGNARENIAIAWHHWNDGAIDVENIEKETTFIALKSIGSSEMENLGMAKEFSELQELTDIISGKYGRLTDDEKQVQYKEFGDQLYKIHSSIN